MPAPRARRKRSSPPSAGNASFGQYPTDAANNAYVYGAAPAPRSDGQPNYGIATWYQLNGRISAILAKGEEGQAQLLSVIRELEKRRQQRLSR